ncbi:MAG: TrkA family potassium uptake protein [Actinomycetales bacterium]|nr:TrkA family potassium uptake protein [Actinomycetales bacterium]
MSVKSPYGGPVLVCGLGRFGAATAAALARLGYEVLAIDRDSKIVQDWSDRLAHVVEADTTDIDVLRELGCADFRVAVVGIATSIESSVLTCANLVDLRVDQVWSKAMSPAHGKILSRIGVHHVIYPEASTAERVARLVNGRMLDYMEFDDGFAIVKMRPPKETQGFTLAQSQIRKKYGVTVVGVKSAGEEFTYASPETLVSSHDVLIVSGHSELVERFASRP